MKLLPRVSLKYFLKTSIKKDVAPSRSNCIVQKMCKSDERYRNYNDFYKSEAYGPLRKSLTEERNVWPRNILNNEQNISLINL